MSAAVGTWEAPKDRLRSITGGPAEGWTSLASVVVIITALAWSIDDAKWVNGVGSLTDFLPLVGLAGVAVGFVGPKLGWGRWTTHLLGVAFAAIVLPIIAGGIVLGSSVTGLGPAALAVRYQEAATIVTHVWIDLGVNRLPFTTEYGHYFIALGAIVWGTGQYASYAVFGHRRSLDAVIVTGLVLLGNMALTQNDQLQLIVLFSLGALALLARSHAFDERTTWLRRRIGDPATVTGLYLRGGAVFITVAVIGSLFLTATASSAPLQGLWKNVPGALVSVSEWAQKFLPGGGESRNPGIVIFGEHSAILAKWTPNDTVAFTAQLPPSETERFKWRVGAYAEFDGHTWSWGPSTTIGIPARDDLLVGAAEDPVELTDRREVRAVITPKSLVAGYVVSPQTIEWVDQSSRVTVIGSQSWFSTVQLDGAPTYTVTALVPSYGNGPDQVTENKLRVASREYSPEIQRLYIGDPSQYIGPNAQKILDDVLAATPDKNPYDLARNMQDYLRSSRFHYQSDVTELVDQSCSGLSTVECFATIRAGYCQYYATTMAILLRAAGIPTRFAQGFLPGERSADGKETVSNSGAHAWVEVYFPGYGWIDFDPTGGNVGQPVSIPSGAPASPTPLPSAVLITDQPGSSGKDPRRTAGTVVPGATDGRPTGTSTGPFIVIAILLLVGAAGLALAAWRRGPRPMHPDRAWQSLASWATRFGVGPRPSQTVYEFAGALGDALPSVRPELATVANAKVEIAYGRHQLGTDRMKLVAEAHRRLRLRLLRLAFRRPRLRKGPKTIRRH